MLSLKLATALMPLAGDMRSIWPFVLIGLAVILIVVIMVVNKNKNK